MSVDRAPAGTSTPAVVPVPLWFQVGDRRLDLAVRPLVVGPGSAGGADLVAATTGGSWHAAWSPAGVVHLDLDGRAGPAELVEWASAGSSVVLGVAAVDGDVDVAAALAGRLLAARAAGIDDERLALHVGARVGAARLATRLGRPVAVELASTGDAEAVGAAVAAVAAGARLLHTGQVVAVRRTCDVLAAVLEAA